MSLDRRTFLWLLGGAGSGTLVSQLPFPGLIARPSDQQRLAAARSQGTEERIISTCMLCPGACGITARKVDGRLVRILGNPNHPISRGGLCPKGIAGGHMLYSPDRIKRPLKRVGARGSGSFEPIEWDEALQLLATVLKKLRADNPRSLAIFDGSHQGSMTALIARFARAFGTPNHIRDYYHDGMLAAAELMHGRRELPAWDLPNARFVLSFGTSLLDGWWSPVWASRAYGELHQGREDVRGELVHFDSRKGTTAIKADRWIPTRPETYGALALGIAYVIVKEQLYDESFLKAHSHGFEDWRDYLLREVSLDQVSDISGVALTTIIGIAKEFAGKRPALAIADQMATQGANGTMTAMAVHALNVLVGSIERSGGVLLAPGVPYTSFDDPELDVAASIGLSAGRIDGADGEDLPLATDSVVRALEAIDAGEPYPIEALFLYYSNPAFSAPQPDRVAAILKKIPTLVSFSPFLDESARLADLILPDLTYLERWDDVVHPAVYPNPTLGIVRPVVPPMFLCRHTGDVLLELAGKLAGPVAAALEWESYDDYLKQRFKGVFEARRGTAFTESFEESQVEMFEESGFWLSAFESFDEFWAQCLETGGWVDPVYHYKEWGRVVRTPSRKIELRSSRLEALRAGSSENTVPGFPRLDEVRPSTVGGGERAGDEQFQLVVFRPLTLSAGTLAPLPWLQEILGYQSNVMWDSWVEVAHEDALALGISDGDEVTLRSESGAIAVRAAVVSGQPAGVLHMPYGLGHTAFSQFAEGIGVNPNALMSLRVTDDHGSPRLVIGVRLEKGVSDA